MRMAGACADLVIGAEAESGRRTQAQRARRRKLFALDIKEVTAE